MQTLEAITCFFVLALLISTLNIQDSPPVDYGFYKYALANDFWRVFYLRGDLHNFNKASLNSDAESITDLTSLCIYFEEEDIASCIPKEDSIVIHKLAYAEGDIKEITMHIGPVK